MPNVENVFEGAVRCGAELVYTVPALIEVCDLNLACASANRRVPAMGARSQESARYQADEGSGQSSRQHFSSSLLTVHLQVFGGAPLNKTVGDSLASQGIALFTGYGR